MSTKINSKKKEQIENFDPNGVGIRGALFGFPFDTETADTVVFPVPWDVTVSYGAGTSGAPEAVLEASPQLDFYDPDLIDAWKYGIAMSDMIEEIKVRSGELRPKAEAYINRLEKGASERDPELRSTAAEINKSSERLNALVEDECSALLREGKNVVLLGGDHSTPLGLIRAVAGTLSARNESFGILQIDAHADLRKAYEGFEYSHASVMYNALKIPNLERLVQVGIRDICEDEVKLIENSEGRVRTFYDWNLKQAAFEGKTWQQQCTEITDALPQNVYLSFDIDGLDPKLCPGTGTPVAGGFELQEVFYLLREVLKSGRRLIAADLNEVGTSEWDANVGARVLYKICNLVKASSL